MTVPAKVNHDADLVFSELINRFEKQLKGKYKRRNKINLQEAIQKVKQGKYISHPRWVKKSILKIGGDKYMDLDVFNLDIKQVINQDLYIEGYYLLKKVEVFYWDYLAGDKCHISETQFSKKERFLNAYRQHKIDRVLRCEVSKEVSVEMKETP